MCVLRPWSGVRTSTSISTSSIVPPPRRRARTSRCRTTTRTTTGSRRSPVSRRAGSRPSEACGDGAVLDSAPRMAAPETPDEILDVNRRYHDVAAADYDAKWGVDFGAVGRAQVRGKVEKLLGARPGPFPRSLEIGSGTGYFTLNLMQEGVIGAGVCTDVSPGMLDALRANAERLGLTVDTVACDAAELPFDDAGFDLVLGHAVLHHLPELGRAFAEFERVLRPGGVLLFAGEPSRRGDRIAALPKRAGLAAAPLWRRLVHARAAANGGNRASDDH